MSDDTTVRPARDITDPAAEMREADVLVCPRGQHETPALAYKVTRVAKILTLRPQDVRTVRAALARYQRLVRRLERQVQASVATLRAQIAREKGTARHGRR